MWRRAISALLFLSCTTWTTTGRLVNDPCVHVGVRPATDGFDNYAITFQVTTDWPLECATRLDAGVDAHP